MDGRPALTSGAEHDQAAGVVSGRPEQESGNPTPAVAVRRAGDDHDAAHVARVEQSAFDRLPPGHHCGRIEWGLLGDGGVRPVDPHPTDVEVGLAGAGEGLDRRVDHRGVQVGAGGVTRTGRVDGGVRAAQPADDRRPIVEVDHGLRGAAGRNDLRLLVVADERGHVVAVFPQFGEYVRSDEPGRAGECHVHGGHRCAAAARSNPGIP